MSDFNTYRPEKKPLDKIAENGSDVEYIKDRSDYLRGTLVESFADPVTGAIAEQDTQLIKFHGTYQQDDRDQRIERQQKKLEPAYSFMIRVRIPGGDLNAGQWLKLDEISDHFANGTLRITTRQAVQFHGIIKNKLKPTIQAMDEAVLDSIAACGDVNRNVMCTPDPSLSPLLAQVFPWAEKISAHLLPRSKAYHEIWLDQPDGTREQVSGSKTRVIEPLYGKHYLPRKFKIAIAVPPFNDTDVYSNDIAITAVGAGANLQGFNIAIGGGLGMTFGREDTYPRLATEIGFCAPEQLLHVCARIIEIQRDYGNRSDRKLSRMKYTIDRYGLDWFVEELQQRLGYELEPTVPVNYQTTGDRYGWHRAVDGRWHLLLFVESGRVKDSEQQPLKTVLAQLARQNLCRFRLTANQNLLLTGFNERDKAWVNELFTRFGMTIDASHLSALRRNAISCVAFNTCPLAMAEAERYLPGLIDRIDGILERYQLTQRDIKLRMTGCPNGCGRSVMAEIGFIGKSLGHYNMYLGGSFNGDRLASLYRENLDEATILSELETLLAHYAEAGKSDEHFGDFVIRAGYVRALEQGKGIHDVSGDSMEDGPEEGSRGN
mgnify:CR=1 FL=1